MLSSFRLSLCTHQMALLGIVLVAASTTLVGCGSSSYESLSPEVETATDGRVLGVTLDLVDFRNSPPLHTTLSNTANRQADAALQAGKLPVTHKIIQNDEMGRLIAFIRDRGFFEYAAPVGNTSTAIPQNTRRVLTLTRENGPTLRMIEVKGMGTEKAGRRDEVVAMSDMNKALRHISNGTPAFRVDRSGRTIRDLVNQPGLKPKRGR